MSSPDHPRIRGEHNGLVVFSLDPHGSSPHTRGAPKPTTTSGSTIRIIPAYAGSTILTKSKNGLAKDHPRIRGEHDDAEAGVGHGQGSSPHTRGARVDRVGHGGCLPDHPRIRGEHVLFLSCDRIQSGSSPHTRGAQPWPNRRVSAGRIIPAYAGSTRLTAGVYDGFGDHPRIRGEHVVPIPGETLACGSSPHTRGARRRSL